MSIKARLNVIFIGPPGAGKGTQADIIRKEFRVCHLATGDMLRAAVKAGTEVGQKAKAAMDAGQLVSDDIMVGVIRDAIHSEECERGFILDGFPRTIPQAEELDRMLESEGEKVTAAINFAIDDELLVKRITGRWLHRASGRTYHSEFHPPKVAGKDDVTGEPLMQRKDDTEEVLKTRLVAFHQYTVPVLAYYEGQGVLTRVEAARNKHFVAGSISKALNKFK